VHRSLHEPVLTRQSLNYTWVNQDRKSVHLAAPTYIDYVMTWVQNLLDDENVFPTKSGKTRTDRRALASSPAPSQATTFRSPSPPPSSTSTASSSVSLPTYTTHTTHKSYTSAPSLTSILSLPTFWRLGGNTSCWTSRTSRVPPTRLSVSDCCGTGGERWASWRDKDKYDSFPLLYHT